ncbi:hypothetical protein FO440_10590 [Mucilaginibacter corticis]|uniref:Uncharacterized protein n=1 Tax=Mucilaginibacter corticis TaxID=2597670 RepID=A0A556MXP7_9SPHI|nr:hypothetical protein [Mucilaginibacter corticis]TSJ44593.1 hypothetical protein FO440_10590 [Mucilaginibacter corticis]
MSTLRKIKLQRRIRVYIGIVIAGLLLSGITAFPLEGELAILVRHQPATGFIGIWLSKVYYAVETTNSKYPFLSYGTDWLAFAHIMLAILFIGPLKNPVKNIWVIEFGLIAAVSIFPLAFIAGSIRGIPFFWTMIDCSFGIVTLLLLVPCYADIKRLNTLA